MNPDELATQRDRERQKDSLVNLDDYHERVRSYLSDLEEQAAQADSPEEKQRLRKEYERSLTIHESIVDRRQGKVLKQASLQSSGYPIETEGMTPGEEELFEKLTDAMEDHREEVLHD